MTTLPNLHVTFALGPKAYSVKVEDSTIELLRTHDRQLAHCLAASTRMLPILEAFIEEARVSGRVIGFNSNLFDAACQLITEAKGGRR